MTKSTKSIFVDENESKETEIETSVEEVIEEKETVPNGNIIELPSKGIHGYPSYVEHRDITVGDEEILSSADTNTFSKVLNGVIKSVLNDCEFYEDITIYDREYLVVWLWANNYNAIKHIPVQCSHCGKEHTHVVDLTKIETTNAKPELKKPFRLTLSKTNSEVNLRLATVADELAVEKYITNNPKADSVRVRLIAAMDIGINLPLAKKVEWVSNNMTGKEFGYVRKFHEHFHYGVDPETSYTCPSCKGVTRGNIPFSIQDVLYPQPVQDDFEELLQSQQDS